MTFRQLVVSLKKLHLLGLENVEVESLACLKRSFAKFLGGPKTESLETWRQHFVAFLVALLWKVQICLVL